MSKTQEQDAAYFEQFAQQHADKLRYPPTVRAEPIDFGNMGVTLLPKHQYYVEPLPLKPYPGYSSEAVGLGLREARIELKVLALSVARRALMIPPPTLLEIVNASGLALDTARFAYQQRAWNEGKTAPTDEEIAEMIATPEQRAKHQERLRDYARRVMPVVNQLLIAWEHETDFQRAAGLANAFTRNEKRYMRSFDESGREEARIGEIEIYDTLVAYGLATKVEVQYPYRDDLGRLIFGVYQMTQFGRLVWRYLRGELK